MEPKSMRKVDGLSLIFIETFMFQLSHHVSIAQTSMQLFVNITLFGVCVGVIRKET